MLPRFRAARRALPILAEREEWPRARIDGFQLDRINAIWGHAASHVPYYRRLATDHRLPPRFTSLREFSARVPSIPEGLVRERPKEFLSSARPRGRWRKTSGSTGAPMAVYWAHRSHQASLQARYRFLVSWDVDLFDRTVMVWGDSLQVEPTVRRVLLRGRRSVEDRLRNRRRLSVPELAPKTLRAHLRAIAAFKPTVIYAYYSATQLLALEARATGFRCDSLRLIILTGETAPPGAAAAIARTFGVPVVEEYGSVECGFIAGEARDRTLRVREDIVFLEATPRQDEGFDLLVTVLTNPAFPLLRYPIGDVVDAPLDVPARGFASMGRVFGRCNDLLVLASGAHFHYAPIVFLLQTEPTIRRFQVHQREDKSVLVSVEMADPGLCLETERLETRLQAMLDGLPVTITIVNAVSPTAAGKHRPFVSDVVVPTREL